jgi:hypothetical protein
VSTAEPGAAPDGRRHVGFWEFIARVIDHDGGNNEGAGLTIPPSVLGRADQIIE